MSDLICMPGDPGYVYPGSPEWHEHLGCSQVANILGHGYKTAKEQWLMMTHRAPDTEHKLIFDRGHEMEPKMSRDVQAMGRVLKGEQVQYRDPERPWLIYHADGMFPKWTRLHEWDKEQSGPGVWEAKAPGYNMTMKMEEDGMSGGYIDQTQIGMHVASAAMGQLVGWATFGYLDYDQYKTICFDCPANADYQKQCLEIIDAFWDCVVRDVPPEPIHPSEMPTPPPVRGTKVLITDGPIPDLVESLVALYDEPHLYRDVKALEPEIKERIKAELGDIQLAEVPGVMRLSYTYGKGKEKVTDPLGLLKYAHHMVGRYNSVLSRLRGVDNPTNTHPEMIDFRRSDWVELKAAPRTFRATRLDGGE